MFSDDLLDEIVYQTNLYARQQNVNTTFKLEKHELMVFIGIVLYMGVNTLPSIEDYWGTYTRVAQVVDSMSSKRFRLIRSLLHFNNNENLLGSSDRFFKIRPLFASLTKQFLQVKENPTQSIDEVMVTYKGTRAGNLRQYIPMRARRWYLRLFGYALDLCVCNAWILYKRDCLAMKDKPMTLKHFRMDISSFTRCQKPMGPSRATRSSPSLHQPANIPRRGVRAELPSSQQRYDVSTLHLPVNVSTRQTCKHCSTKAEVHRSRWMCEVCKVALCLSDSRNCFKVFHLPPGDSQ